jgi:hypothetical protein
VAITVTNGDLERLVSCQPEIFANKKLPAKLLYWLSRLKKDCETNYKEFMEARVKIFEQHCSKDENGNVLFGKNGEYTFQPEVTAALSKEINDLRDIEIEITNYGKIKIDLADHLLENALSANDLTVLDPFIEVIEPV